MAFNYPKNQSIQQQFHSIFTSQTGQERDDADLEVGGRAEQDQTHRRDAGQDGGLGGGGEEGGRLGRQDALLDEHDAPGDAGQLHGHRGQGLG